MTMRERIIVKTTLSDLPLLRDRYPFLYLEHGRLEIDDSSVKWISADGEVFRLPAAVISTLLLGPGTSVTHEAVKILASLNCTVCWVRTTRRWPLCRRTARSCGTCPRRTVCTAWTRRWV